MKSRQFQKILFYGVLMSSMAGTQALAADDTAQNVPSQPENVKKMAPMSGTPVSAAHTGGTIVPKGVLLSTLSYSYRDKDDIVEDAGFGARTMEQELYILKLRYGLTDHLEVIFVPGYIDMDRDAYGPFGSDHIDGSTDFFLGATYAPFLQRLGDPLSFNMTFGVNMPTGQEGPEHPVGGDVWSYTAKMGITKIWHPNHRVDVDLGIVQPTETGNQDVKKDTVWSITGGYKYVFNPTFDMGLEFTAENCRDWERNGINIQNGSTEVYVGPTMNYVIPKWKVWLGAGLYFPIVRDYDVATATDDIRLEIKLGKIWSF